MPEEVFSYGLMAFFMSLHQRCEQDADFGKKNECKILTKNLVDAICLGETLSHKLFHNTNSSGAMDLMTSGMRKGDLKMVATGFDKILLGKR